MVLSRQRLLPFAVVVTAFALLWSMNDYAPFSLLGVLGAIFANATGAGGGVVFIPAFQKLGLTELQSVSTSFAIQCCGMTTGAIVWWRHAKEQVKTESDWRFLIPFCTASIPASLIGLWLVYGFNLQPPGALLWLFAWFSIALGVALFIAVYLKNKQHAAELQRHHGKSRDLFALAVISLFGGVITAWLSVGVGEFVAFYLILRGYRVTLSVAVAVILSAFTVWAGLPHHIINGEIQTSILMFAGPGAVIGAIIARMLATRLPVIQLKLFFAGWVFLVGLIELLTH